MGSPGTAVLNIVDAIGGSEKACPARHDGRKVRHYLRQDDVQVAPCTVVCRMGFEDPARTVCDESVFSMSLGENTSLPHDSVARGFTALVSNRRWVSEFTGGRVGAIARQTTGGRLQVPARIVPAFVMVASPRPPSWQSPQ